MACVPLANDLKDPQTMIDPDALEMKLAHAASYREDTPGDDEMMEVYERHAYNDHDTLIELGGRPTRAVLAKPAWKAIYDRDQIRIVDNHGALECTLAPDENLTLHHWSEESSRFQEELDRWREFQDYQKKNEHHPLLKIAFDPENTDQRLVTILVRLNDWREFQRYQQVKVGRATMLTWKITRTMGKTMRKEATTDEATPSPEISYKIATCLRELFPRQQGLETSEMQLRWIESQIPEMLLEACTSLETAYPLQRQLEIKLEQQANAFYQELEFLEARPDHSVQSPRQSASCTQKICHWGSEVTRLMHELWEWRIFLKWRKGQPSVSETANLGQQGSSGRSLDLLIWVDHVDYRRFQLDRTRSWVASWQRLLKKKENRMKTAPKDLELIFLQTSTTMVRAYVEKFQRDIHTAESQLRLAEQQLAELSSQQSSSTRVHVPQQSTKRAGLPPPSPPQSKPVESTSGDHQPMNPSSSPTEVHRSQESTKSPISGTPISVQRSKIPNRSKRIRPEKGSVNKRQPVTVTDVVVPDQVIVDDELQLTDAPDCSYPHEAIEEDKGAEPLDTLMIDVEDAVNTDSRHAPGVGFKGRSTRVARKLPLPIYQVPTTRKTRSVTKLDSGRILKCRGKKMAKKAMTFTEQQSLVLQNAASTSCPATGPISLRKSERLKRKAEASYSYSRLCPDLS